MKRIIGLLLIIATVASLVAGCSPFDNTTTSATSNAITTPYSEGIPPNDVNWITPSKVTVGSALYTCSEGHEIKLISKADTIYCPECGLIYDSDECSYSERRFYAGARAEQEMTIHNGNSYPTTFSITYRVPDNLTGGYSIAPAEAQDWVTISEEEVIIESFGERVVLVVLDMPKKTKAPDHWEFWISVKDTTQQGMVHVELCTKWLINMRTED